MEQKIKVMIKRPFQDAFVTEIENTLQDLYDTIGCKTIEMQHLPNIRGVVMCMDEDGKYRKLDGNFFVPAFADRIVGTCIFSSCDDEGELAGLNEKQIKEIKRFTKFFGMNAGEDLYGEDGLYYIARAIEREKRYTNSEDEL